MWWWALLIFYLLMQIPLGILIGTFIRHGTALSEDQSSAKKSLK
jgi:hypothetical protein